MQEAPGRSPHRYKAPVTVGIRVGPPDLCWDMRCRWVPNYVSFISAGESPRPLAGPTLSQRDRPGDPGSLAGGRLQGKPSPQAGNSLPYQGNAEAALSV